MAAAVKPGTVHPPSCLDLGTSDRQKSSSEESLTLREKSGKNYHRIRCVGMQQKL